MSEYEGRIFSDGILYSGEYELISDFGTRALPNGDIRYHKGIDFFGIDNKDILSPVNGIVAVSTIITDRKNLTWEWGEYVRIDSNDYMHIDGAQRHYFCHLSERTVSAGQSVKKGDKIGIEGNTGYVVGNSGLHCHYEVRDSKSNSIDPKKLFWNDNQPSVPIDPDDTIYNSISEVPEWVRQYVQNWVDKGIVMGTGIGLNLTMSMIRIMVMVERMISQASLGDAKRLLSDGVETSTKIQNYLNSDKSDINYIKMYDKYIRFVTALTNGDNEVQVKDKNDNLLYWSSEEHEEMIIDETEYPVMAYDYNEIVKTEMAFYELAETEVIARSEKTMNTKMMSEFEETVDETESLNYAPQIVLGQGDGVTEKSTKAEIYKGQTGLEINYYRSNTEELRQLVLDDDGIKINMPDYNTNGIVRNIIITTDEPDISMGSINDVIIQI